jgi:hypothetical protein
MNDRDIFGWVLNVIGKLGVSQMLLAVTDCELLTQVCPELIQPLVVDDILSGPDCTRMVLVGYLVHLVGCIVTVENTVSG